MPSSNPIRPGIVIAGTKSGAGKSSFTMGLLRRLRNQGLSAQPFKVGPDFIDPQHHARASGRPSYNLDTWMSPATYVLDLYSDIMGDKDIAVVEGVMGLFDGAGSTEETASTAEAAKLLNLPVLLVVDGQAMARSVAALVKGFAEFDPGLRFAGVVANNVNGERHAAILREAINRYTPVRWLGYLPRLPDLEIPSRHLGLHLGQEQVDSLYDRWAAHLQQYIDIEGLLTSTGHSASPGGGRAMSGGHRFGNAARRPFTVSVAMDEAFQFVYQDTLDLFRHRGGNIVFFAPTRDARLPAGTDWVYLPGGYPELHLARLSQNRAMLADIRRFHDANGVIVAECGGLMYLGKSIADESGKAYPMAGIFDFSTSMSGRRLTLGYRQLRLETPGGRASTLVIKGHEFHFSAFAENRERACMQAFGGGHYRNNADGFFRKNCFAFYTHIYWASSPGWMEYVLQRLDRQGERH
jgi:cobyrinic acid a,c-diamide synthase